MTNDQMHKLIVWGIIILLNVFMISSFAGKPHNDVSDLTAYEDD